MQPSVRCFKQAFRTPVRTGSRGRPLLLIWPGLVIGQMVKRYARGRVTGVEERLVHGDRAQLASLLAAERKISTAYIERLNATFRARLYCLARRGRSLARLPETVTGGMYLVGCLYNFCTPHQSLGKDEPRSPAMAAGLTTHIWTVGELLSFRPVPPPKPPRRPGRTPKGPQEIASRKFITV